jgi:hypothetical protein
MQLTSPHLEGGSPLKLRPQAKKKRQSYFFHRKISAPIRMADTRTKFSMVFGARSQ